MISEFANEKDFLKFIEDNDLEVTSELSSTDMYCAYGIKKKGVSFFQKKIQPTDFYVCFMYNLKGDSQFSFGMKDMITEYNFIKKIKEALSSEFK